MPDADLARAQIFGADLLRWETRGPGDTANAMHRVAKAAGVPFAKLWALRYRPPKAVASHVLAALEAAHAAAIERQLRKLAHDVEITARVAGAAHPAVRAGEALLRAADAGAGAPGRGAGDGPPRADGRCGHGPAAMTDLPLWRVRNEGE